MTDKEPQEIIAQRVSDRLGKIIDDLGFDQEQVQTVFSKAFANNAPVKAAEMDEGMRQMGITVGADYTLSALSAPGDEGTFVRKMLYAPLTLLRSLPEMILQKKGPYQKDAYKTVGSSTVFLDYALVHALQALKELKRTHRGLKDLTAEEVKFAQAIGAEFRSPQDKDIQALYQDMIKLHEATIHERIGKFRRLYNPFESLAAEIDKNKGVQGQEIHQDGKTMVFWFMPGDFQQMEAQGVPMAQEMTLVNGLFAKTAFNIAKKDFPNLVMTEVLTMEKEGKPFIVFAAPKGAKFPRDLMQGALRKAQALFAVECWETSTDAAGNKVHTFKLPPEYKDFFAKEPEADLSDIARRKGSDFLFRQMLTGVLGMNNIKPLKEGDALALSDDAMKELQRSIKLTRALGA